MNTFDKDTFENDLADAMGISQDRVFVSGVLVLILYDACAHVPLTKPHGTALVSSHLEARAAS